MEYGSGGDGDDNDDADNAANDADDHCTVRKFGVRKELKQHRMGKDVNASSAQEAKSRQCRWCGSNSSRMGLIRSNPVLPERLSSTLWVVRKGSARWA